jgi:hypothetical protein
MPTSDVHSPKSPDLEQRLAHPSSSMRTLAWRRSHSSSAMRPRAITLKIYAHLLRKDDGNAGAAINAALSAKPKA